MKNTNKIIKNLSDDQYEAFLIFFGLMKEYNEHTNITRITNTKDFWNKHIIDSLLPFDDELNGNESIIDIGTGAGFPGVVLALIYPNAKITLVDSNLKKIKFLKIIKSELNLSNITIINNRAEDLDKDLKASFDIGTARALAPLTILVELIAPYIKINGKLILLKGPNYKDEEKELGDNYKILGLEKNYIKEYVIEDNQRTALIFKKNKITPIIYPRNYAKIKRVKFFKQEK